MNQRAAMPGHFFLSINQIYLLNIASAHSTHRAQGNENNFEDHVSRLRLLFDYCGWLLEELLVFCFAECTAPHAGFYRHLC